MSEKPSFLERPTPPVVGSATEGRKVEVQKIITAKFGENRSQLPKSSLKKLAALENPKQGFERRIIADTNQITDVFLIKAGAHIFDIPEENIYMIPDSLYSELDADEGSPAICNAQHQMIAINTDKISSPLQKAAVIGHEMVHLKNFLSLEANNRGRYSPRREGMVSHSSLKKDESIGEFSAFIGLNEAVVAEMEKKIFPILVRRNPVLKAEWDRLFTSERKKLLEERGIPEEEIYFMDDKGFSTFSYPEQRKVLSYIMDTIALKLPEEFPNRDEVFNRLFLKAHFSGELLPLARVMKSVFGEDALRVLGIMSAKDKNSARLTMDYFQKKGGRRKPASKQRETSKT